MRKCLLGFAVMLGIACPLAAASADATVTITNVSSFNVFWSVDTGKDANKQQRLLGTVTARYQTGVRITVYGEAGVPLRRGRLCNYLVPSGDVVWTMAVTVAAGSSGRALNCTQSAN